MRGPEERTIYIWETLSGRKEFKTRENPQLAIHKLILVSTIFKNALMHMTKVLLVRESERENLPTHILVI